MSGPWIVEYDDMGGPYVFTDGDRAELIVRHGSDPAFGFPTKADAWDHALDCLLMRRDLIRSHITEARAELRRARRTPPRTTRREGV